MDKLGINPLGLLAQIINFFIILWLLKKFLYGPVMTVIQERQKKIAQSMDDVKKIEERLGKMENTIHKKLTEADRQVNQIIIEAKTSGQKIQKQAQSQAQAEAKKIISQAEARLKIKEQQMIKKVEGKVADLAIVMTEKIIKGLDPEVKYKLTQNSIKQISKTLN